MTDKVQKIIAEIKDRISNYQEYIDSGYDDEEVIKQEELKDLLTFIDSLQEEPKECMYSKDNYTDEDRKALCDGCETECRFNKKEEPISEDTPFEPIGIPADAVELANIPNKKEPTIPDIVDEHFWEMLGEEPVSEDLEEAALLHLQKHYDTSVIWDEDEKCVVRDFKAGANWKEQHLMANAVDVEVKVDAGGYPYIPHIELYDYYKDAPLAKGGDKYKVILIKEE